MPILWIPHSFAAFLYFGWIDPDIMSVIDEPDFMPFLFDWIYAVHTTHSTRVVSRSCSFLSVLNSIVPDISYVWMYYSQCENFFFLHVKYVKLRIMNMFSALNIETTTKNE